jgi:hypothetical protein
LLTDTAKSQKSTFVCERQTINSGFTQSADTVKTPIAERKKGAPALFSVSASVSATLNFPNTNGADIADSQVLAVRAEYQMVDEFD